MVLSFLSVSTGAKEKGITAGIAVRATITPRGDVCRSDLWRFDKSRSLAGPGRGQRDVATFMALPGRPADPGAHGDSGLPLCPAGGVLRESQPPGGDLHRPLEICRQVHFRESRDQKSVITLSRI